MLVAFSITNRACFRDQQELSMEAVKGTADRFAFDTDVRQAPRLNRVAAIYGPNGSGKSRFVEGLDFAQTFVLNSSRENQAGEAIPHEPFLFDEDSRKRPTVFETTFVQDGTLYQYGFAVDAVRVHREWLLAWPPGGRMRRLLERFTDPDTGEQEYEFSPSVRGSKSVWRQNTRPNALFVSTAVQLNSDTFRPIVDWFRRLKHRRRRRHPTELDCDGGRKGPRDEAGVLRLLRAADMAFADVRMEKEKVQLVHRPGASGECHSLATGGGVGRNPTLLRLGRVRSRTRPGGRHR